MIEAELPDGTILEFPDGTSPDVIQKTARRLMGVSEPEQRAQSVLPDVVAEGVSALNRGSANIPDFFIDAGNAATGLVGDLFKAATPLAALPDSGNEFPKIPRVQDTLESATGGAFGQKNFMEPGLARTIVQEGGEFVPGAATAFVGGAPTVAQRTQGLVDDASREAAITAGRLRVGDKRAVGQRLSQTGEVIDDAVARKAVEQGLFDTEVSMIKKASKPTRNKMREMVDIADDIVFRGQEGARTSRVLGDSAGKRLKHVANVNQRAGKAINAEARKLSKETVDAVSARRGLVDNLRETGATLGDDGVELSQSEILPNAKAILDDVVKRFDSADGNALKLHRLKRFIDKKVSYGKQLEGGLDSDAQRILKRFRRDIDSVLDSNFANYKQANESYSETRDAIDKFAKLAGKTFDMDNPRAAERIGTLSRRVFSNAQSKDDVINALDGLDEIAQKNGLNVGDDLIQLARFDEELKRVFKPLTRTSTTFRGEAGKAVVDAATEGVVRSAINAGGRKAKELLSVAPDDEKLLSTLRELLSDSPAQ